MRKTKRKTNKTHKRRNVNTNKRTTNTSSVFLKFILPITKRTPNKSKKHRNTKNIQLHTTNIQFITNIPIRRRKNTKSNPK